MLWRASWRRMVRTRGGTHHGDADSGDNRPSYRGGRAAVSERGGTHELERDGSEVAHLRGIRERPHGVRGRNEWRGLRGCRRRGRVPGRGSRWPDAVVVVLLG